MLKFLIKFPSWNLLPLLHLLYFSAIYSLARWNFHLKLTIPIILVVIYYLYHELGHFEATLWGIYYSPSYEFHMSASSTSPPHITSRSQGPWFSNSTICFFIYGVDGHLARQCPRYMRSTTQNYPSRSTLSPMIVCTYCDSSNHLQLGWIMHL